jgi:uncharacterized C2H2 Zn-finger protein
MIKCPKCEHEFEEVKDYSEEDILSIKDYQKSGLEYMKRRMRFSGEIKKNQSPPSQTSNNTLP